MRYLVDIYVLIYLYEEGGRVPGMYLIPEELTGKT